MIGVERAGRGLAVGALRVGVLTVLFVLAAIPSRAQTPAAASSPAPSSPSLAATPSFIGFVSPYEVTHTLRAAGFNPLAPPLREGTTYVVRATDYRGMLMRVVVDARTGAIRDANRIVPGPGRYGQLYGGTPYDPAGIDVALPTPNDNDGGLPPPPLPSATRLPNHPPVPVVPLPRPRPAAFISRKPDGGVRPAGIPAATPEVNSAIITAAPPPGLDTPKLSPAAAPPVND
jgi:hypothetical protein